MSQIQKKRSPSRLASSIIAVLVVSLCGLHAARAADPDIPRIQAAAAKGSIQQQIELGDAYLAGRGVVRDGGDIRKETCTRRCSCPLLILTDRRAARDSSSKGAEMNERANLNPSSPRSDLGLIDLYLANGSK